MPTIAEELIELKVALKGAKEATAELKKLNSEQTKATTGAVKTGKATKQVSDAQEKAATATTKNKVAQEATTASTTRLAAALAAAKSQTTGVAVGMASATSATGALATAARGLGTVMATALGPIGLVASALVAAAMSAKAYFDDAEQSAKEMAKTFKEANATIQELTRSMWDQREIGDIESQIDSEQDRLDLLNEQIEAMEAKGVKEAKIAEKRAEAHLYEDGILKKKQQIADKALKSNTDAIINQVAETKKLEVLLEHQQSIRNKSTEQEEKLKALTDDLVESRTKLMSLRNAEIGLTATMLAQEKELSKVVAARAAAATARQEGKDAASKAASKQGALNNIVGRYANRKLSEKDLSKVVVELQKAGLDDEVGPTLAMLRKKSAKKSSKGSKKAEKEEKIEARFGDYRDVLKAYADSRAGVDGKALESLSKGMMPKDHRPETSIQITNNNNYTFENEIVIDGSGKSNRGVAQDIAGLLRQEVSKAIKQTPNGLVR